MPNRCEILFTTSLGFDPQIFGCPVICFDFVWTFVAYRAIDNEFREQMRKYSSFPIKLKFGKWKSVWTRYSRENGDFLLNETFKHIFDKPGALTEENWIPFYRTVCTLTKRYFSFGGVLLGNWSWFQAPNEASPFQRGIRTAIREKREPHNPAQRGLEEIVVWNGVPPHVHMVASRRVAEGDRPNTHTTGLYQ